MELNDVQCYLDTIARLALLYNKYETRVEARLLPNLDHRPKRGGQVQLSFQPRLNRPTYGCVVLGGPFSFPRLIHSLVFL